MASSRHAGHAGPCLSGRRASARHQGERTSTSRQTCCPLRFPRCAGSSGISSGQGRPIPVASSLGRTGDDDTSSAPDDHTGPAEPELINPGCSTKALSTIADMLHRLGLSHKKKSLRASEQDRPDVARHRRRWRVWQRHMDGERFVFIEETEATTAMTRLYGWSPRGERLVDAAPFGHWKTTTVVAGLRGSGIIAPFVLDGPMTGEAFRAYVEQVLAPALEPGDV